MPVAIITGSGGLIGSEAVTHFVEAGFDVVGVENNMRARLFGEQASTAETTMRLSRLHPELQVVDLDIRDADGIMRLFSRHRRRIGLVVHTAAQPSHDWAASAPQVDFTINANGTLNLLEASR